MKIRSNRLGEPKPAQAVGALIICPETGRALLQHRDRTSDSPLTWGTFGGGVDDLPDGGREKLRQALLRELEEECAFKGDIDLVPLNKFTSDDGTFQYFTYIGLVPKEFTPVTNHETEGYKWFNVTDRSSYPKPLHPGLKDVIDTHWDRICECVDASYSLSAQTVKRGSNLSVSEWGRVRAELETALLPDNKAKVTSLGSKGDVEMIAVRSDRWQGVALRTERGKIVGALEISLVSKDEVLAVFLDAKYRGTGLGLALYLGAIREFGVLRSSSELGIMAVKTWAKVAKYHDVSLVDIAKRKAVPFKWDKAGMPLIGGQPMDAGMNKDRQFVFVAKR